MLLHLIRHPPPQIAAGVCYGRSDVAVRAQDCLRIAADLLGQGGWPQGAPVFSSPSQRCRALALRLHAAPVFDARLMEMDFGLWEMRAWDDIPRQEVDAWAADTVHYRPGGGESAEQMAHRIMAFLSDLHERAGPEAVIVGHGGSLRLLSAWQAGMTPAQLAQKVCISPQHFAFGACIKLQLAI